MSPGAQQIEDLRHQLARLDPADVAHHLGAGARLLAGQDRALERLEAVLGDHVLRHAHLDAEHHVGVLGDRPGGLVHPREVDVVELRHREAGEPDIGDVHEGVEAGARLRRPRGGGRRRNCWRRHRRPTRRWWCIGSPPARRPECRSPSHRERRGCAGRSAPASPACRRRRARAARGRPGCRPRPPRSGRSGCRCRACRAATGSDRARRRP